MIASRATVSLPAAGLRSARPAAAEPRRAAPVARAIEGLGLALNLVESAAVGSALVAINTVTAENRDAELAKLQSMDTNVVAPVLMAVLLDAIFHSVQGMEAASLPMEIIGAAAGAAYMFSVLLSSRYVDPNTLAPRGSILNADKAQDSRKNVRVPFYDIIYTVHRVTDPSNDMCSGEGWTGGDSQLPKMPVRAVLFCIGMGVIALELTSHGIPGLSAVMPRALQLAGWVATFGLVLRQKSPIVA